MLSVNDVYVCVVVVVLVLSRFVFFDVDVFRASVWFASWNFIFEVDFYYVYVEVDCEL